MLVKENEIVQTDKMYYKDAEERKEVPKQLLSAYLDVKANVESKRKKIHANLARGIKPPLFLAFFYFFFFDLANILQNCKLRQKRKQLSELKHVRRLPQLPPLCNYIVTYGNILNP